MSDRAQASLTDEQVVRVLAEREGWTETNNRILWKKHRLERDSWKSDFYRKRSAFTYLTSRDALQPVLDGLSEEERVKLVVRLLYQIKAQTVLSAIPEILTLPVRDLAYAIASALMQNKEANK